MGVNLTLTSLLVYATEIDMLSNILHAEWSILSKPNNMITIVFLISLQIYLSIYARKVIQTLTNVWRPPSNQSFRIWPKDTRNWGFRPSNRSSYHLWKSTKAKVPANQSALTWSLRTSRSWVWPAQWSIPWKSMLTITRCPARLVSQSHSRSLDNTRSTERCSFCRSPVTDRVKLSCVSF